MEKAVERKKVGMILSTVPKSCRKWMNYVPDSEHHHDVSETAIATYINTRVRAFARRLYLLPFVYSLSILHFFNTKMAASNLSGSSGERATKIVYRGANDQEFFVIANPGMASKWRKDKTIPLIDVVQCNYYYWTLYGSSQNINTAILI